MVKKDYNAKYYAENRENVLAQKKEYYRLNKEKIQQAKRDRKQVNPEKAREYIRESSKRWREQHPEYAKENSRKWREEHPGYDQSSCKKWRSKPGNNTAKCQRRRAAPGKISVEEIRRVLQDPCAYCGLASNQLEHCTPVCRGGWNSADNCVAACSRCNASKGSKTVLEFFGLWPVNNDRRRFIKMKTEPAA